LSSQRAELAGILSLVSFLKHSSQYFDTQPRLHASVLIVCDNKGAIEHATPKDYKPSAIRANHNDYDLVAEIHSAIKASGLRIKLQWVKGHQDRNAPPGKILTQEAQLNIIADSLASEYIKELNNLPAPLVQTPTMLPSTNARLLLGRSPITSNHKLHIRTASNLPALQAYILRRNDWTRETWDSIEWDSHTRALSKLSWAKRNTITKFLHKWLPTAHNMRKRSANNSRKCQQCPHDDETDDHVCQCPHDGAEAIRRSGLASLKAILTKSHTDTALQLLFIHGIESWMCDGNDMLEVDPPHEHPFSAQLQVAIQEQNVIGWNQILRGRISQSWGLCFISCQAAQPSPPHQKDSTATQWTTRIATWGIELALELWYHRNKCAFESTPTHTACNHARLQARVQELYSRAPTLGRSDQDAYFNIELDDFQSSSPHILEVWITQVEKVLIQHRKEITQGLINQGLITHHFQPLNPLNQT
jgi:hypothetical protein